MLGCCLPVICLTGFPAAGMRLEPPRDDLIQRQKIACWRRDLGHRGLAAFEGHA